MSIIAYIIAMVIKDLIIGRILINLVVYMMSHAVIDNNHASISDWILKRNSIAHRTTVYLNLIFPDKGKLIIRNTLSRTMIDRAAASFNPGRLNA